MRPHHRSAGSQYFPAGFQEPSLSGQPDHVVLEIRSAVRLPEVGPNVEITAGGHFAYLRSSFAVGRPLVLIQRLYKLLEQLQAPPGRWQKRSSVSGTLLT